MRGEGDERALRQVHGSWAKGNVELLLSACAEDFVFDDAIDGRFTKAEFPAYFGSARCARPRGGMPG